MVVKRLSDASSTSPQTGLQEQRKAAQMAAQNPCGPEPLHTEAFTDGMQQALSDALRHNTKADWQCASCSTCKTYVNTVTTALTVQVCVVGAKKGLC